MKRERKKPTSSIQNIPADCIGVITCFFEKQNEFYNFILVCRFFYDVLHNPYYHCCRNITFTINKKNYSLFSSRIESRTSGSPFIHILSLDSSGRLFDFSTSLLLKYFEKNKIKSLFLRGKILVDRGTIRKLFESLESLNVYTYKFNNPHFDLVDEDFESLSIANCSQIQDKHFQYFVNLEELDIRNNSSISNKAFFHLKNLKKLNMSKCYQGSITDECFQYLKKIEHLTIKSNNQKLFTQRASDLLKDCRGIIACECSTKIEGKFFCKIYKLECHSCHFNQQYCPFCFDKHKSNECKLLCFFCRNIFCMDCFCSACVKCNRDACWDDCGNYCECCEKFFCKECDQKVIWSNMIICSGCSLEVYEDTVFCDDCKIEMEKNCCH